MDSGSGNSVVELGRFITGFLVVTGIGMLYLLDPWAGHWLIHDFYPALPAVLAHCDIIRVEAMVMSIVGGLLIYSTIIMFTMFFREQEEF
jgi:hypothetical protein